MHQAPDCQIWISSEIKSESHPFLKSYGYKFLFIYSVTMFWWEWVQTGCFIKNPIPMTTEKVSGVSRNLYKFIYQLESGSEAYVLWNVYLKQDEDRSIPVVFLFYILTLSIDKVSLFIYLFILLSA